MLFGLSEEETAKNSLFDVAGEKIKNVGEFTYLGHKISNKDVNDMDTSSTE